MPDIARRFRRAAALVMGAELVAFVAVLLLGSVLVSRGDVATGFTALGLAAAFGAAVIVLAVIAFPRLRALSRARAANPDGAVFLARRQPSVVSDLATYLDDPEIYDQVSDRWVVASIDHRGLGVWSVEAVPRELVLVPWQVIGSIEPIRLENGRPGAAVDVQPFPTPLVVAVGYAAFGVMASFGRQGVSEVVATANALRPPVVE